MKIVARKSDLYNLSDFKEKVTSTPFISAIAIYITITKDKQIVVFNPIVDTASSLATIQNSTIEQIQNTDIITLEDYLTDYQNTDLKVFINVAPLQDLPVGIENIEAINAQHQEYASRIVEVVTNFNDMELYIYSIDRRIVTYLKQMKTTYKVGVYLFQGDSTYIDVDLYLFTPDILDITLMKQQIQLGKEIAAFVLTSEQMERAFLYFENAQEDKQEKQFIFENTFFITNYPEIFYSGITYYSEKSS